MGIDLSHLPDNTQALGRQLSGAVKTQAITIEQLKLQIARLTRMQYGASSEKLAAEIEQLELKLDDLQQEAAVSEARLPEPLRSDLAKPSRKPLPNHLPREDEVHEPARTGTGSRQDQDRQAVGLCPRWRQEHSVPLVTSLKA